jgi:hypothetical protein
MFGNSMESAVINVLDNQLDKITQTMEQRIEAIVQAKMMEMMEGMTEGMKKFQSEQQQHSSSISVDTHLQAKLQEEINKILEVKEETVEAPLIDWEKAYAIDEAEKAKATKERPRPVMADAPRPKKADFFSDISMAGIEDLPQLNHTSGYRYGLSKNDIEKIAPYLLGIYKKYAGVTMRSADVIKVLREEYDVRIVNPTMTFRKMMTLDPSFENVGFGVYKYEEKSFKPTV